MEFMLGFVRIMYSILGLNEIEVPIRLVNEPSYYNGDSKFKEFLLDEHSKSDIEEILQLGRLAYIAYADVNGELDNDEDFASHRLKDFNIFRSKVEQDATNFAQLFTMEVLKIIKERAGETSVIHYWLENLDGPYDISDHGFNDEDEKKIQQELNESYIRVKDKFDSKIKDCKSLFVKHLFYC